METQEIVSREVYSWLEEATTVISLDRLERALHCALEEGAVARGLSVPRLGDRLDHVEIDRARRRVRFIGRSGDGYTVLG